MEHIDYRSVTGTVFNIQKFCTDDGPGIRTSVFLKGCHLHCAWCHNPEGIPRNPILQYSDLDCIRCRRCEAVCPNGVHSFHNILHNVDRSRCTLCGACVSQCGCNALSFCSKPMTAGEVFQIAMADRFFYEQEGGITVTGGEPLLQPEFVLALGTLAKEQGIHFCVETSGALPFSVLETVLPVVDLFLLDIKETDEARHLHYTGISNRLTMENLRKLDGLGKRVLLRCPIIPSVNDRQAHFEELARIYASLNNAAGIQLMPYHPMGQGKTLRYGVTSQIFPVPDSQEIDRWNQALKDAIASII